MKYSFEVTRTTSADVTVAGGGTAGVFAAIAAARCGARTILIEKNSMLGGTITTAAVDFPGLFFAWGKQIIDGPCWEAVKRAEALHGAKIPEIVYKPQWHWQEQVRLNRFAYIYVMNEMLKEAGVTVITSAMISAAEEEKEQLSLFVTDKSGLFKIDTKFAIDATGDANLAAIMGYPCEKSRIQQPATLQNRITGYEMEKVNFEDLERKLAETDLDIPEELTAARLKEFLRLHKIDIHTLCRDADTSTGKTKVEQDAVSNLMKVCIFLRTVEGLGDLVVDFAAEETGIRETNRIVGEKIITQEEYVKGVFYPDSVCYTFYPIDLHVKDGIEQTFLKEDVVPKIPYGALIPKGSRRLLCAGRCISSDQYANSAIRVQAPCMATGQAAGCAAALCAADHVEVKQADYQKLTALLKKIGAIVPEA